MAEYHVGCGAFGIYAGTVKKNGKEWSSKTEVTDEALCAVRDWLAQEAAMNKSDSWGYEWDRKDGKIVELVVNIRDPKVESGNENE